MMSKFVPLDPSGQPLSIDCPAQNTPLTRRLIQHGFFLLAVPSERPRLAPGAREKIMSNWARRFAKKAKVAVSQHDKFLWKKRVFEEAKNSEYLLEKPLYAETTPE